MSGIRWHLAQVNIARLRAPLNGPQMTGLRARVDEMNLLAEQSPGYVWRLHGEIVTEEILNVFSRYVVPFDPALLFYKLSVWKSVEHLQHFVTNTAHAEILRNRNRWMAAFERATLALWWIQAGHMPTIAESAETLMSVDRNGPTESAFTFRRTFKPSEKNSSGDVLSR